MLSTVKNIAVVAAATFAVAAPAAGAAAPRIGSSAELRPAAAVG